MKDFYTEYMQGQKEEKVNLTEDVINTCYDVMAVESRPNAKEFVDESTLLYKAVHTMTADQKLKFQTHLGFIKIQ